MKNVRNERLEFLSDNVRKGIPISFTEALEVIEYQENLKTNKEKSFFKQVLKWFK